MGVATPAIRKRSVPPTAKSDHGRGKRPVLASEQTNAMASRAIAHESTATTMAG